MKRIAVLLAVALLVCSAVFLSQSMLKTRLLELRIAIDKDQILRYELSSRLLQYRFRQSMQDLENSRAELKLAVLESHVMNNLSRQYPDPGFEEKAGITVINAVRALLFKPHFSILEKRLKLIHLHAGFFQERSRSCPSALAIYRRIETKEDSADSAFVLLHTGYCEAVTGSTDRAEAVLGQVISRFPGTHFERSAREILDKLAQRRSLSERAAGLPDEEAAEALFRAGDFAAVDRLLSRSARSRRAQYLLARSKEETGQTEAAAKLYRELISAGDEAGKQAATRLLLLGTIYSQEPGESADIENLARKTGDPALFKEIEQAVLERKPASVEADPEAKASGLARMSEPEPPRAPAPAPHPAPAPAKPRAGETAPPVPELKAPAAAERKIPAEPQAKPQIEPRLRFDLTDGRALSGRSAAIQEDRALIEAGRPVVVPLAVVHRISLEGAPQGYFICAVSKERKTVCGSALQVEGGVFRAGEYSIRIEEASAILVEKTQ